MADNQRPPRGETQTRADDTSRQGLVPATEGTDPLLRAAMVRRGKHHGPVRRSRQQDRGPRTEYLAFTLGGDVYAAPVSRIREILKPPPLTHVPRAPREVLGIVSVRGQLVTVVDLRRRLRLAEPEVTRRARILLADAAYGEVMGLLVDEVLQVYRLSDAEIEPAASALGGEVASYIAGIARPGGRDAGLAKGARGREGAPEERGSARRGRAPDAASPPPRALPIGPEEREGAVLDASVVVLLDLRSVLGA